MGTFPDDKAAGREADLSPRSSAELKNKWSLSLLPHNPLQCVQRQLKPYQA